jgi:hypothetical protein
LCCCKQINRANDFVAEKCPAFRHWRDRHFILRAFSYLWCFTLFMASITLAFLTYNGMTSSGDSAYNRAFLAYLDDMEAQNKTFQSVCLFRGCTYVCEIPSMDDLLHHEGVLMTVANAYGQLESLLQFEYGHSGVFWQVLDKPHPDPRYSSWPEPVSENCYYQCGTVANEHQSPQTLLGWFKKYHPWHYNTFRYNCVSFARMVYHLHAPTDVTCVSKDKMHVLR